MSGLEASAQNIYNWLVPGTGILVLAGIFVCGIMMTLPSKELHDKVKSHVPHLIIGAVVIMGAAVISRELISKIVF